MGHQFPQQGYVEYRNEPRPMDQPNEQLAYENIYIQQDPRLTGSQDQQHIIESVQSPREYPSQNQSSVISGNHENGFSQYDDYGGSKYPATSYFHAAQSVQLPDQSTGSMFSSCNYDQYDNIQNNDGCQSSGYYQESFVDYDARITGNCDNTTKPPIVQQHLQQVQSKYVMQNDNMEQSEVVPIVSSVSDHFNLVPTFSQQTVARPQHFNSINYNMDLDVADLTFHQQPNQQSQLFQTNADVRYVHCLQQPHQRQPQREAIMLSDKIDTYKRTTVPMESALQRQLSVPRRLQQSFYYAHDTKQQQQRQQIIGPRSVQFISSHVNQIPRDNLNFIAYDERFYVGLTETEQFDVSSVPSTVFASPVATLGHTAPIGELSACDANSSEHSSFDASSGAMVKDNVTFDNVFNRTSVNNEQMGAAAPTIMSMPPSTSRSHGRSEYVMSQFVDNTGSKSKQSHEQQSSKQVNILDDGVNMARDQFSEATTLIQSVPDRVVSNAVYKSSSNQQEYLEMGASGNVPQDWLDTICRHLIEHMNNFGICVIDNFLGSIKGELILKEVHQLYSNGQYSKGRLVSNKLNRDGREVDTGDGNEKTQGEQQKNGGSPVKNFTSTNSGETVLNNHAQVRDPSTIRNDRVIWVDGCEDGCSEINNLIQTLCSVVTNSSRLSLYSNNGLDRVVINKRTKAHVACYPGNGTRYIKHVDNPNGDGRVITAIYYLNKSWNIKRDGGLLRMFPAGMDEVANIEPLFDRALFFWSDRRNPHEVLPAHRDRFAITVWFIGEGRT